MPGTITLMIYNHSQGKTRRQKGGSQLFEVSMTIKDLMHAFPN